MTPAKSSSWFTRFAKGIARATGQPVTFALALCVVLAWAISGPLFHWSDTWQLVINTGTTIVTFLMVFLIQSTQNRDSEAVQIKLDELLRISPGAHNVLMNLEELEERELGRIRAVYVRLAENARKGVDDGISDEGVPDIDDLVEKQKKGEHR
ncbi:MAG: low affinity iron permease family protein [Pseudomonadota bacterium]